MKDNLKKVYKKMIYIFLFCCLICGCIPSFKYSLVDVRSNKIDERLYGMWIQVQPTEDGKSFEDVAEYSFIQILPSKRGVEIVVFLQPEEGYPETVYFSGYPSIINGEGYLNFRFSFDAEDEYYLIRYKILSNGILQTFHVDEKILKQLIESNKLQGIVEKDDISVTATKTELLKFLESNNIFDTSNPGYFRFKDIGLSLS